MKFEITAKHIWDSAPHPKAAREKCIRVDRRTTDDPGKIPFYHGQDPKVWWYGEGSDHRTENGQIARNFPGERWVVETPDDLAGFMAWIYEAGFVCVSGSHRENLPELPHMNIEND